MTRKEELPWLFSVGSLLIALLVCIGLLAYQPNYKNPSVQIDLLRQEYRRNLSDVERNAEIKTNRLQEQINSLQFTSNKRIDLLDEDIRLLKRELEDLTARLKAQHQ